jgi:N-acetylglucosamine kinase-like BadF-type ATPase
VTRPSEIVTAIYAQDFDRSRIASLAPEVVAACAACPDTSLRLLYTAGEALAEMVVAVARSLGWLSGALPVGAAGGFLLSAAPILPAMTESLARQGYQASVTRVPDPVRGALVLAERALAVAPSPLASSIPEGLS